MGSGFVVSNETSEPLTSEVASRSADPYTPVKAWARNDPAERGEQLAANDGHAAATGRAGGDGCGTTGMGEEAFATAWETGRAMPLDDAIAQAVAFLDIVKHDRAAIPQETPAQ